MWFKQLTGFQETSPAEVRANLRIEGDSFVAQPSGNKFAFGTLQIPTLLELKKQSPPREVYKDKIRVSEVVADVQVLHELIENEKALFQAASQFNLLEMVNSRISPESGIDRYENDHTQGPACAIACGAGTIYRNYFVKIGSQIGQTTDKQIDCLDLIGQELQNEEMNYWTMQNGYAMFSQEGLVGLNQKLVSLNTHEREALKEKLKTGIQWNTEVTTSITRHKVSQIYCSALPVAYCQVDTPHWEHFSRIILEATYEATLYAALINWEKNKSDKVYLTLVGGGAFGNEEPWILESLQLALRKFRNTPLDIQVVSYGHSNINLLKAISEI